jgi:hypothetical protein
MSRSTIGLSWLVSAVITVLAVFCADPVFAQSQEKGDAALRIEYQYIHTGDFKDENFTFDYWTTDSHIALLSGDYAITDRWTVFAAIPYVQKRFNAGELFGGDPHNPNDPWWIDYVPPDKRFIDDESFHGGLQDLSFGVSYLALDGPLTISPYIGYGFPTTSYPFYAKAAIGQNLWNIPVGLSIGYIPYFSDWQFDGNLAYVFSEKPLDINVDYWLAYLSGRYWFKPQFAMNIFVSAKWIRNGLVMPWDFTDDPFYGNYPGDFDTIEWWQHDRLLRHRFVNLGIGFDYFMNEKYLLSGTFFKTIWSEQTNQVDRAFTLALTRYWGED